MIEVVVLLIAPGIILLLSRNIGYVCVWYLTVALSQLRFN